MLGLCWTIMISDAFMVSEEFERFHPHLSWSPPKVVVVSRDIAM